VSRDTISRITDKVVEEMTEWANRPPDAVYPVIFVDAIHVKIRDGQVTSRLVYAAIGVSIHSERDILGLGPATAGKGPSSGSGCSPRSATAAWPMCASWSATGSRACRGR
jgi:hypothetical protein